MSRRRRGWKKGDWLVQDEESGFTTYGKSVGRDYYGVLKIKKEMDRAHPQMFVRAKDDPFVMDPVNPPFRDYAEACESYAGFYVGNTNVETPIGPATHLFRPAIPDAVVGCSLYVYPGDGTVPVVEGNWLLESGSGYFLLEDSSGVILLE